MRRWTGREIDSESRRSHGKATGNWSSVRLPVAESEPSDVLDLSLLIDVHGPAASPSISVY